MTKNKRDVVAAALIIATTVALTVLLPRNDHLLPCGGPIQTLFWNCAKATTITLP